MSTAIEISKLSEEELREKISAFGIRVGPLNSSTRPLYEKKLLRLLQTDNPTPSKGTTAGKPNRIQPDSPKSEEDIRNEISQLSNEELVAKITSHGLKAGPITTSTRPLYEKKLINFLRSSGYSNVCPKTSIGQSKTSTSSASQNHGDHEEEFEDDDDLEKMDWK